MWVRTAVLAPRARSSGPPPGPDRCWPYGQQGAAGKVAGTVTTAGIAGALGARVPSTGRAHARLPNRGDGGLRLVRAGRWLRVLAGGDVKTPDAGCVNGSGRCPAQRYRAVGRLEFEAGHRDHRSDRSDRDRVEREDRTTALTLTRVCRQAAIATRLCDRYPPWKA